MEKKRTQSVASTRPRTDVIVNIRFTAEEAQRLRAAADTEARTLANFARLVTLVGLGEPHRVSRRPIGLSQTGMV